MKSVQRGRRTLSAEVTHVSTTGLWVLVEAREFFLAFTDFPWFADATIRQITRVERPSPHHLYWPDLDIDLAVESLEDPSKFPLVSQARSNKRLQPTKARDVRRRERSPRPRLRG